MKINKLLVMCTVMLCLATIIGQAEAKDLIFAQGYNNVGVVDADTDEIVANIPIDGFGREMVWTEDNKTMYLLTQRRNLVKIDLTQMKVVKTVDLSADGWQRMIWGLALANDKRTAYINSVDRKVDGGDVQVRQTISQIDLENGKVLRSMTAPWGVASLVYQKDGKTLFAVGRDIFKIDLTQKEMKVYDTYSMQHKDYLPIWPSTRENGDVFLDPYYTSEYMGMVSIDANTGKIAERKVNGPPILAYCLVYSPDKKKVYAMMDDINVIDLETNNVVKTVPNAEGTSFAIMVTSDGKKLYVGAGGSTITVYDAETLQVLKVVQMQTDSVDLHRVSL